MAFKPCAACPSPAKCKAAGKCMKKTKKMAMGGTTTDMMPPNYGQQQKQQIGGSMTPCMMNKGGMGKKKKTTAKGPAIMIAIAVPAKKGGKRATGTRKK